MRKLLLLSILCFVPGCIVAVVGVGAAAGILAHEAYVADDSYQGIYRCSLEEAYEASLNVMDNVALSASFNRRDHSVEGEVNSSKVNIQVTHYDEDKKEVKVLVTARKYGLADQNTAVGVFRKINDRLIKSSKP